MSLVLFRRNTLTQKDKTRIRAEVQFRDTDAPNSTVILYSTISPRGLSFLTMPNDLTSDRSNH